MRQRDLMAQTNERFRSKHSGLAVRGRHLLLVAVAAAAVGLILSIVYVRRYSSSDLASTLARAGLPELPGSVTNLTVVEKGRDPRNTYVRFSAEPNEIDDFINGTTSKKARKRPITLSSVDWVRRAYPPWWVPKECKQGRVYYLEYRRGGGALAIDDASNTAYLNIWYTRPAWIRRLTRYLP